MKRQTKTRGRDRQAARSAAPRRRYVEPAPYHQERLAFAVWYAVTSGCFFPVPEPALDAPVDEWVQWGAMRHLHDAIAEAFR